MKCNSHIRSYVHVYLIHLFVELVRYTMVKADALIFRSRSYSEWSVTAHSYSIYCLGVTTHFPHCSTGLRIDWYTESANVNTQINSPTTPCEEAIDILQK